MQADVWAAYDILSRVRETNSHRERAHELMGFLQQFILKLALTPEEIAALPRNYSMSQSEHGLPDVFDENSGWIEVEWLPYRLHDEGADHRRAARVFLKPAIKFQKFLTDMNASLEQGKYPQAAKNDKLLPFTETYTAQAGLPTIALRQAPASLISGVYQKESRKSWTWQEAFRSLYVR